MYLKECTSIQFHSKIYLYTITCHKRNIYCFEQIHIISGIFILLSTIFSESFDDIKKCNTSYAWMTLIGYCLVNIVVSQIQKLYDVFFVHMTALEKQKISEGCSRNSVTNYEFYLLITIKMRAGM